MEDEKTQAGRTAQLIEAGLSEEEALAKIEVFADLSDEQFEALAEAITVAKPFKNAEVKKHDEEEDKEKAKPTKMIKGDPDKIKAEEESEASEEESFEEAEAEVVDEEVLETASVEEAIDMTVASEETEDEIEHVRANLRNWVNSYVLKTEQGESE